MVSRLPSLFNPCIRPLIALGLALGCHTPLGETPEGPSLSGATAEFSLEHMHVEWELRLPREYRNAFVVADGPVPIQSETASTLHGVALHLTCVETQFRGVPQSVVPAADGLAILQTEASNPGVYGIPYRAPPPRTSLA